MRRATSAGARHSPWRGPCLSFYSRGQRGRAWVTRREQRPMPKRRWGEVVGQTWRIVVAVVVVVEEQNKFLGDRTRPTRFSTTTRFRKDPAHRGNCLLSRLSFCLLAIQQQPPPSIRSSSSGARQSQRRDRDSRERLFPLVFAHFSE